MSELFIFFFLFRTIPDNFFPTKAVLDQKTTDNLCNEINNRELDTSSKTLRSKKLKQACIVLDDYDVSSPVGKSPIDSIRGLVESINNNKVLALPPVSSAIKSMIETCSTTNTANESTRVDSKAKLIGNLNLRTIYDGYNNKRPVGFSFLSSSTRVLKSPVKTLNRTAAFTHSYPQVVGCLDDLESVENDVLEQKNIDSKISEKIVINKSKVSFRRKKRSASQQKTELSPPLKIRISMKHLDKDKAEGLVKKNISERETSKSKCARKELNMRPSRTHRTRSKNLSDNCSSVVKKTKTKRIDPIIIALKNIRKYDSVRRNRNLVLEDINRKESFRLKRSRRIIARKCSEKTSTSRLPISIKNTENLAIPKNPNSVTIVKHSNENVGNKLSKNKSNRKRKRRKVLPVITSEIVTSSTHDENPLNCPSAEQYIDHENNCNVGNPLSLEKLIKDPMMIDIKDEEPVIADLVEMDTFSLHLEASAKLETNKSPCIIDCSNEVNLSNEASCLVAPQLAAGERKTDVKNVAVPKEIDLLCHEKDVSPEQKPKEVLFVCKPRTKNRRKPIKVLKSLPNPADEQKTDIEPPTTQKGKKRVTENSHNTRFKGTKSVIPSLNLSPRKIRRKKLGTGLPESPLVIPQLIMPQNSSYQLSPPIKENKNTVLISIPSISEANEVVETEIMGYKDIVRNSMSDDTEEKLSVKNIHSKKKRKKKSMILDCYKTLKPLTRGTDEIRNGDIVWGRCLGHGWWPGYVGSFFKGKDDVSMAHVSWLSSNTKSFMSISDLDLFLPHFLKRFASNKKGVYIKAVVEAQNLCKSKYGVL